MSRMLFHWHFGQQKSKHHQKSLIIEVLQLHTRIVLLKDSDFNHLFQAWHPVDDISNLQIKYQIPIQKHTLAGRNNNHIHFVNNFSWTLSGHIYFHPFLLSSQTSNQLGPATTSVSRNVKLCRLRARPSHQWMRRLLWPEDKRCFKNRRKTLGKIRWVQKLLVYTPEN